MSGKTAVGVGQNQRSVFKRAAKSLYRCRLHIEVLENRTLLSVTPVVPYPFQESGFVGEDPHAVGVTAVSNRSITPPDVGSSLLPISISSSARSWTPVGPAPVSNGQISGGGAVSGRIAALAAHPTDPNTIYAGAAYGGVWKTTNAGASWTPLTDAQATLSMGAIAIAPSNPNVIYAGTGEANNSGDSFYGRGVLKSTDGGTTWTLLGSSQFDRHTISKIAVDPNNANLVYVAVAGGGAVGLSGNTGIWKSVDGGANWSNTTTSISTNAAFSDLVMDASNPQTLYAAVGTHSGDASNGMYKTTNAGVSWAPAGNFPTGSTSGRIAVAISASSDQVLYASVATPAGALYGVMKTIDGGNTWSKLTNTPDFMGGKQGWYDNTVAVDPADPNVVYAGGSSNGSLFGLIKSTDGGNSWVDIATGTDGSGVHTDDHALTFDAAGNLLDGDDGGIFRTTNRGATWQDLNTNINSIQFTGIATDPNNPNIAYGGSQDNGTEKFNGSLGWKQIRGGDGGYVRVDQANPNTIYHTYNYGPGFLERSDDGGATFSNKTSGINTSDPASFYPPYVMDPANSSRLLLGTNRVYETTNRADLWSPISTPNTNGWNSSSPILSLAAAKTSPSTIYASDAAKIFVTFNDGTTWTEHDITGVSSNISQLSVDPTNNMTAYAVLGGFGLGGHVFRTTNGGATWTSISGSLPNVPTKAFAFNPVGPVLYVGTDTGVYQSTDLGTTWTVLGSNFPRTRVVELEYNANLQILAAGTHGRGLWEMSMANPLEFRVNTYTPWYQDGPTIASDAAGDYVVAWNSFHDPDGSDGISAQRYNAAGVPQGAEFRVNTYITGYQDVASVAMDSAGDFVVAWQSDAQDGSGTGIYAQRYNAAGVAQGSEFRVNTYTTGNQDFPSVAMDQFGDFVVTWQSAGQDGSSYGVYAQSYDFTGVALGSEFQVNTYTTDNQSNSSVTMDAFGDFVVAWNSWNQDGSGGGIYAQRYDFTGTPLGSEFRVNTFTTNTQYVPSAAMDAAGDFVVAWQSAGQDGSGYGIYAQRYNAAGVAQGSEFNVNTYTTSDQRNPRVAMDSAGDFVVAWQSSGQDGSGLGIYAQRFNNAGVAQGTEFRANTYTTADQQNARVAMDATGDFVVAWQSYGQDGDRDGIYAKRYYTNTSPTVPALDSQTGETILPSGSVSSAVTSLIVQFSSAMNDAGGAVGATSVMNPANYQLLQGSTDISVTISGITYGFNPASGHFEATVALASPLHSGSYQFTARQALQDANGNGLDGDNNGVAGGDFVRSFSVAPISSVGPEFQVNTYTPWYQVNPSIASDAAGDYVVAWEGFHDLDGSDGISAQRYNAAGVPQGAEFRVNTYITGYQDFASVAMDSAGDFVVTWQSDGQDGSGTGIYAQRYNAAGVALGSEFRVNTYTTGNQNFPSVAMDQFGDFVVTWQSYGQDGDRDGIFAQRYNPAGVAQGGEFQVNTYTTNDQRYSSVTMDAVGDFVVAWNSWNQDGSGGGIYSQRYNAAGAAQGSEFRVNTFTTNTQYVPSAAMDSAGDFVVTWQSAQDGSGYGIYAQRYNAAGVAQGSEFQVNTYPTSDQINPRVSLDSAADFVVAWQSSGQDGSGKGIYAQRYNAAGAAQGTEFRVNTYTTADQQNARVAMDSSGDFVVAWQSYGQDGERDGIFAQRYAKTSLTVTALASQTGEAILPAGTASHEITSLVVQFSAAMSAAGGASGANSVTNPANYQLLQGIIDISSTISGITYGFNPASGHFEATVALASPLRAGSYQFTARQALQDANGNGLDGDNNGLAGGDFMRTFSVASVFGIGPEFRANTYTPWYQSNPAIASDAAGDYVVAWDSFHDPDGSDGISAQRYNVAGVPQGAEFRVNTYITGYQDFASVAMDAAGDFVVVWQSDAQDGSGSGIYAQRYNAAGVAQGSEFRVNTYTTGNQVGASVAMDSAGDFVVAWVSNGQDGSGYGVYAQRYNPAGVAQGGEFQVNTYTTNDQGNSSVTMDAVGDFVVAWSSWNQDGSGGGIYSQRYNAAGVAQGSEFRVNTFTTNTQWAPSTAMDSAGDFVVAWESAGQDGSGNGIYAQRYNAAGVAQGSEFNVNTYTTSDQINPRVSLDSAGDFVVAWQSNGQDGSGYGIYAQRYNNAGVAQATEFRVNTYTTANQQNARVAMDAMGDFVVAWQSYNQDGDRDGIYAQRYFVTRSSVVGRELFYSGSARYDQPGGTNGRPASIPFSDDNAIASDKSAYLPGSGAATFANVSSYDRGINGIMVDLLGGGSHTSITLAGILNDFTFKVGNNNSPGTWATNTILPTTVTVRSGAGVAGSDRVELVWADGTITEKWLEVTVLATANTGLAANDVFFFGNEIGATGASNTATIAKVSASDVTDTQTHGATLKANLPVTNIYDFNKDGQVGAADVTDSQTHGTTNKTGLNFINIGAGGPFAPEVVNAAAATSNDSGIASALASTSTSPTPIAIPPWIVNRLSHLDLNSGRIARYFEHLAHENTAKTKAALAEADEVADAANLDDQLLDTLLAKLGLE